MSGAFDRVHTTARSMLFKFAAESVSHSGYKNVFDILPSPRGGMGCFAIRDIEAGTPVGLSAIVLPEPDYLNRRRIVLTKLGRFSNYDQQPNMDTVAHGDGYIARATRDIFSGEELLFSFRYDADLAKMGVPWSATLLNGTTPGTQTTDEATVNNFPDSL